MSNMFINSLIGQKITYDNLLFYSKFIDFISKQSLTKSQLNQYSKFFWNLANVNISKYKKVNYRLLCLYFQGIPRIDMTLEIIDCIFLISKEKKEGRNNDFLVLLYNLIELEYRYLVCDTQLKNILLTQLHNCTSLKKNYIESQLFDYYKFFLYFDLGNYQQCNNIGLNSIIDNEANVELPNHRAFHSYLKLRMNIIFWKINMAQNQNSKDQAINFENKLILQELFSDLKPVNAFNATKVGLNLSNVLIMNYNYNEAFLLLIEIYYNIKKEIRKGIRINNPQELFLQILARLGYVSVFLGFEPEMIQMTKKYHKRYSLLTQYEKEADITPVKRSLYGYCLAMLQMIIGRNSSLIKESTTALIDQFLFCNKNVELFDIINTCLLDPTNPEMKEIFKNQISIATMYLQQESKLTTNFLFALFLMYNAISIESKIAVKDKDYDNNKQDNNDNMMDRADLILSAAKPFFENDKKNPVFQLVYVRVVFIRVMFWKCYWEFKNNNKEEFEKEIGNVERLKEDLIGTDPFAKKEYSMIIKLKGDFAYKNKKYEEAVNCYKEALINLSILKQKALVYFNLGLAYYYMKDCFLARKCMNECYNDYQTLIQKEKCIEYQAKINVVDQILNFIIAVDKIE